MYGYNKQKVKGFTLIELVIVITILGILAAVAIPKFLNLSVDAQIAATNGVAGALASAAASNYAARSENPTLTGTAAVTNCTAVSGLLQSMPTGYTIAASAIAAGATVNCTLTGPSANGSVISTTFAAVGVS